MEIILFIAAVAAMNSHICTATYDAVVWCSKTVNTHTQVLAVAEQCLHAVQAVFFPNSVSLANRLRVSKKLEGDTADPNRPEV